MAGKVVWSDRAKADLKDILGYWKKRNQSNTYSKYLKKKILPNLVILSIFDTRQHPDKLNNNIK